MWGLLTVQTASSHECGASDDRRGVYRCFGDLNGSKKHASVAVDDLSSDDCIDVGATAHVRLLVSEGIYIVCLCGGNSVVVAKCCDHVL